MSGRGGQGRGNNNRGGRGYRGGRGGRGRSGRSSGSTSSKQPEFKFYPHGSGKQQQSVTYGTVKEKIESYVQKTFKDGQDIADSLRELKKKALKGLKPDRDLSTKPDAEKAVEQVGLDIIYKAKVQRWIERQDTLESNLSKAYALIFDNYCAKSMQSRVEQHPDFEKQIRNDPIELLKTIKVVMHDPVRGKYPYSSLT